MDLQKQSNGWFVKYAFGTQMANTIFFYNVKIKLLKTKLYLFRKEQNVLIDT